MAAAKTLIAVASQSRSAATDDGIHDLAVETCNTSSPAFTSQLSSPISAETDLAAFNFTPASGSPLVGAGIAIAGITTDYNGTTRPNPPAIGAIQ
jgi:hypothetical protein